MYEYVRAHLFAARVRAASTLSIDPRPLRPLVCPHFSSASLTASARLSDDAGCEPPCKRTQSIASSSRHDW